MQVDPRLQPRASGLNSNVGVCFMGIHSAAPQLHINPRFIGSNDLVSTRINGSGNLTNGHARADPSTGAKPHS